VCARLQVSVQCLRFAPISQLINQHELAMAPHIQALGREKYNKNTTASQCDNNDSANR